MESHNDEKINAAVTLPWDEIGGPQTEDVPSAEENQVEWVDAEGRVQVGERWLIEKNR